MCVCVYIYLCVCVFMCVSLCVRVCFKFTSIGVIVIVQVNVQFSIVDDLRPGDINESIPTHSVIH